MILRCHSNRDGQNGARRCGSSPTEGTLLLFRLIIQEKLRATYGFAMRLWLLVSATLETVHGEKRLGMPCWQGLNYLRGPL
jgi:hypothetical protein